MATHSGYSTELRNHRDAQPVLCIAATQRNPSRQSISSSFTMATQQRLRKQKRVSIDVDGYSWRGQISLLALINSAMKTKASHNSAFVQCRVEQIPKSHMFVLWRHCTKPRPVTSNVKRTRLTKIAMTELNKRHLISDTQLIDSLVNQLSVVSSDIDNWTKTFIDKTTNENWISYYVDTSHHGGGHNILGRLPLPSTDKLIDIAIHSENEDEVFAACRTLTENEELRKQDFRKALIDKLETLLDKDRRKEVIELTGLSSPLNRQDILGKTSEQIENDAKFYKQIADRADKLKRQ